MGIFDAKEKAFRHAQAGMWPLCAAAVAMRGLRVDLLGLCHLL